MPSASRVHWAKFRVSVVSAVAVIIMATLAYLLTGGTLLEQKSTIYLYIPDATGLEKASPVRVDGIDVGKVARVELSGQNDPNRVVRVVMTVERERLEAIPADSYAELSSDSLIGDKFVDITSQRSSAHVQPFGEIHLKPPSPLMKNADLPTLEAQLRQVDALLADIQGGRSQMGQFVQGNQMYLDLRNSIGKIQNAFHAAVSTTTVVGDALYNQTLYNSVAEPMAKLERTLAGLQSGQGTAGQLLRDSAQYDSSLKQVRDLRDSIAQVRAGVWMQSDQMYKDWNRTLVSFIQQMDRMNADPLLNSTAVYESLTGMANEARETARDFRQDPKKYLRLKLF
jgi:phospholipid/cholesterol/gamma-HCH transport system substrate-binding protein